MNPPYLAALSLVGFLLWLVIAGLGVTLLVLLIKRLTRGSRPASGPVGLVSPPPDPARVPPSGGGSLPGADKSQGRVRGRLMNEDGAPIPAVHVALLGRQLRGETGLDKAMTDRLGLYAFTYRRPETSLNLFVRAYDASGQMLAESATVFAPAAEVEINLTTAKDGVVRRPSRFVILKSAVSAQLGDTPIPDLQENKETHEIRFVAKSVGAPFADVACLVMAGRLAARNRLEETTLFGLLSQGIPPSAGTALANLPEAGIDETFTAQVLSGMLAHSRDMLGHALTAAVATNILPASCAGLQETELARLDELRAKNVAGAAYVRGKTALKDLLAAGAIAEAAGTAFIQAYANSGRKLGPTWRKLRANKNLTKADFAALNATLSAGELLSGNLPLVKDTLKRLSAKTLARVQNLALLDQGAWEERLREVDPEAASIPPVLKEETPEQRIARFAQSLAGRFASRYPTTAFVGGLTGKKESSFVTKKELIGVLSAHPALNFKRTNIDQYVAANEIVLTPPALEELKSAQRLYRISPHYTSIEALKKSGYQSAQSIYLKGRTPFVAHMKADLGSPARANAAFSRAEMIHATSLVLFGRFHLSLNGTGFAVNPSPVPDPDTIKDLPSLQALFGSLDYCECTDCRSVCSPAAYLVDLLQFLKQRAATGGTYANACAVLLARRPDLQYLALNCNNTEVMPYIDPVNEILEAAIAPPATPVTVIDTTGTAEERRALPQRISADAYDLTNQAVFQLSLPFDLPFAQTTAYLAALGTSLAAVMNLFRVSPGGPGEAAIACARLGINPKMQGVINGSDPHQPWERWGLARNLPTVLDPKTRVAYSPVPTDWVAALGKVPVLLNRSGLSLQQLYQLLETKWVTAAGVTLQVGTDPGDGIPIVSCDTDKMSFTNLTGDVLDRANRFLRLQSATGLTIWELDWALDQTAGGLIDDGFLVFLSTALAAGRQLNLPFQEILTFWGPLQTRDVTNHLDGGDTPVPSTYSAVFRNPTIRAAWDKVLGPAGSLTGAPIIVPSVPPPTSGQAAPGDALTAALALSGDDIAAIRAFTGVANTLTVDTLGVLLRYARLSSALSLPVPDLILWIQLTAGQPFGGTPADTLEFLRRLAVLQKTGLAVHDLDYLLRQQSGAQSPLAFTASRATAVLRSIRDAVTKLFATSKTLRDAVGAGAALSPGDVAAIQTIIIQALATESGVAANVVTPVLLRPGILPLDANTVSLLLAQTSGVDPTLFPTLINAFTAVAKAAAAFQALHPTVAEFAFVVQHATRFNWLDLGALPTAPVAVSPYAAFEALLRALAINQRQPARAPKFFDLLGGWLGALPPDLATAITADLAFALKGSVADVAALAAALGIQTPSLLPATQPGSLCDMAAVAALTEALDVVSRYGISGTSLAQLAASPPTGGTAKTAMGAFQAQYASNEWFAAVQPVEDKLREKRRDALVAYLLGPGPADTSVPPLGSVDEIFDYYLLDPEMNAAASTTRLLFGALTIQQFVQQCHLDLVPEVKVDATADPHWLEWSWRQQFRLWQLNRYVFLYPENYLRPELRKDKSPFFKDFENELRQSNCDAAAATTAFENYLRKVVEVSQLVVRAHYNETKPDGSLVLHVFAHTSGSPAKWYYRSRTEAVLGAGIWSAWLPLNLDIPLGQLLPVVWDQRLHLIWPVFNLESEKEKAQPVPAGGGGEPAGAPSKYWAVELAMSEFSAGHWQAKKTISEKFFFKKTAIDPDPLAGKSVVIDRPPLAFTFRAYQDHWANLWIEAYYSTSNEEATALADFAAIGLHNAGVSWGRIKDLLKNLPATGQVAFGTLAMPDAPLVVNQQSGSSFDLLPAPDTIDLSLNPSYALIKKIALSGSLVTPTSYGFSGQDLVFGSYAQSNPGSVPLNVLCASTNTGLPTSIKLLGAIENPRLIVPQQEHNFDSVDPFFVSDPSRVFFVQPQHFTISSNPQEIGDLTYAPQWSTKFRFEPFYHPFARTFLRELEIGGIPRLMRRNLQLDPEAVRGRQPKFNFQTLYKPDFSAMDPILPAEEVAYAVGSAYGLYNWELFYHGPMFVMSLLLKNQQYESAITWLKYIFDPTDPSSSPVPGHYWQTRPFYEMNATDWLKEQIQSILNKLARDKQEGVSDSDTVAAIADWLRNPFDPHRIARLRISAYARATVMAFLDTLLAWGDSLYSQYTMEKVHYAEQLYVFANLILGPEPSRVRLPVKDQAIDADTMTYATIAPQLDQFSNALVEVENLIVAPTPPLQQDQSTTPAPSLPQIAVGTAETLFFCIPRNDQLLAYWSKVAQRLYNIRHGLNLQGIAQPLALYAPAITSLDDAAAQAGGIAGGAVFTPVYRFSSYLQKALDLTNDVRAYGALILSALEKSDAEALAILRSNQDLDLQTRILDVKKRQVTEAQDQVTVLQKQKAVTQTRYDFYSKIAFMNDWEIAALSLQGAALILNGVAVVLDMTSGGAHLAPKVTAGVSGFGGTPLMTVTYGGENVGNSTASWASVSRGLAGLLGEAGGMAATMGGYQRRKDDWDLQTKLAAAELAQIDSQIAAATVRWQIAGSELANQNVQIANAQVVSDFLTNKYTNKDLYDWMLSQLTTVHTQAYQLAFGLAQQAEAAFQYELGSPEKFVQFGYWDSQHKGLTAGESLLFDLRQMEAQYLTGNTRELELTKDVSLALTQPVALVNLLETGSCNITLDEALFDRDHPGHYFRRLRSVALTIPCVTGPYSGIHAHLTLNTATVRMTNTLPGGIYTPSPAAPPPADPATFHVTNPGATMATSTGQRDAGLFDVNLRDERWLPFEGHGAISQFSLSLDPADNNFDVSTITDVILHIRYTARLGIPEPVVRAAIKPKATEIRSILVSVRHTFSDAYYRFFNPADTTATQQTLALPFANPLFPFSNLGSPKLRGITVHVVLAQAPVAIGAPLAATLGPTSGAASALPLGLRAGSTSAGNPIPVLSSSITLPAPLAPEAFTLTLPETSVPAALGQTSNGHVRLDPRKIEDIVLIIDYAIV